MRHGRPWIDRRYPSPLKRGFRQCRVGGSGPYGGPVLCLSHALLPLVGQRSLYVRRRVRFGLNPNPKVRFGHIRYIIAASEGVNWLLHMHTCNQVMVLTHCCIRRSQLTLAHAYPQSSNDLGTQSHGPSHGGTLVRQACFQS